MTAQDSIAKTIAHQIELRHDNDFFALTDHYYSSGLYLIYRTTLNRGLFGTGEQLDLSIGQEVYTPSQISATDPNDFDRPYAGFLGLNSRWSKGKKGRLISTALLLGMAGPNSGAGGLQRWYHKNIAVSDAPTWIGELNDSFHINFYASYLMEWQLAPLPFGVNLALKPKVAFGSRDSFVQTQMLVFFGRRNLTHLSIAHNRLGNNQREIFFSLSFGYRKVFWNGLIQGNGLFDTSEFLGDINPDLVFFGFDFNHRFKRNDYRFGIRHNNRETPQSKAHIYFQMGYALSLFK